MDKGLMIALRRPSDCDKALYKKNIRIFSIIAGILSHYLMYISVPDAEKLGLGLQSPMRASPHQVAFPDVKYKHRLVADSTSYRLMIKPWERGMLG